jgi:peptidoglycan/xylan/chitin deacetylase (PgdA/CDA1 family)
MKNGMSFYVAAYDTEAIYPWWELGDQKYSAQLYQESVSYEGERLRECLAGVRAVAEVHLRLDAPATFFLVGKLVEHARRELRALLDQPIFDLQCHSYTHANLMEISNDPAALQHELMDSKRLIEDTFGRPVIGLTSPGGFVKGLAGQTDILDAVWEAGYRYVRSVGLGPFDSVPAPLTQPFWYTQDGFADLLELGLHAWHDNHLTGQPGIAHWPPILPWGLPANTAQTAQEVYQAYAPGIDYVAEHNLLTYIPCFHPWSIYRVDRQARQIELLLSHARRTLTVECCTSVYEKILRDRSLASEDLST